MAKILLDERGAIQFDEHGVAELLTEAVKAVYHSERNQLEVLKGLHAYHLPRDPKLAGALWVALSRLAQEARLCKFCGYGTLVAINGEDYCTRCDSTELARLLAEKDAKEAVARAL